MQTGSAVLPRDKRGVDNWFNTAVFKRPSGRGDLGNNCDNAKFTNPGFNNHDLSLFKNFQMGERKKFQFRCSAYNFMNHPLWTFAGLGPGSSDLNLNFGPNTTGSGQVQTNSGFGVTPIKIGNRIIQLALKYYF